MSLHDIFTAIQTKISATLLAIWHYPIPWEFLTRLAILTAIAMFVGFLIWNFCKQIWLALVAYRQKRRD